MYIQERSLDDILNTVYTKLLGRPLDVEATKGNSSEVFGCLIELSNPRARLSITETRGKAFSPLGELLWYLSKSNNLDFIKYYIPPYVHFSDDKETVYGGYGPRLFKKDGNIDQVSNIINLLREKPSSRRAVIQLFDAKDLLDYHKDIPCTTTLQFAIREDKLILMASMRSNDAFLGLPHDIFCFTMLQELIAVTLGIEIGTYYHSIGSLHLYEKNREDAQKYMEEGLQSNKYEMPKVPMKDPWESIQNVIKAEKEIRQGIFNEDSILNLDPYWKDFIYLLIIHKLLKNRDFESIKVILKKINDSLYNSFIEEKIKTLKKNNS